MRTSRPTAITPAWCAPALSHAIYAFERTARAPWCGPVAVGRDVPIAPPRLGAVPGLASRAFAARRGGAPRFRGAGGDRTPRPARLWGAHGDAPSKTLSVCYLQSHATAGAWRRWRGRGGREGSGRADCKAVHRAEARRRDGDIAPYRHYARGGSPSPANFARNAPALCTIPPSLAPRCRTPLRTPRSGPVAVRRRAIARGGSPPRAAAPWRGAVARRAK